MSMSLSKGFQPLYKQVYDLLTERLVNGYWKASEPLPSEMALADELGVSQGTVRKALNQMVAENLLQRRQGKGTYVAEHTNEGSLFRFFRWRQPQGDSLIPETEIIQSSRRRASEDECIKLNLGDNNSVVELHRRRSLLGETVIFEKVIQPLAVFPDIDQVKDIPNALYKLYQEKYGITIVSVRDELKAIAADKECAVNLDLLEGTPILMVERKSVSIDGRVVEYSQAFCHSDHFVYAVEIK